MVLSSYMCLYHMIQIITLVEVLLKGNITIYCILHGQIKGFNRSTTTILFEVGS